MKMGRRVQEKGAEWGRNDKISGFVTEWEHWTQEEGPQARQGSCLRGWSSSFKCIFQSLRTKWASGLPSLFIQWLWFQQLGCSTLEVHSNHLVGFKHLYQHQWDSPRSPEMLIHSVWGGVQMMALFSQSAGDFNVEIPAVKTALLHPTPGWCRAQR